MPDGVEGGGCSEGCWSAAPTVPRIGAVVGVGALGGPVACNAGRS
jgi:hypothetical protein